jgi:Cupin-like domain
MKVPVERVGMRSFRDATVGSKEPYKIQIAFQRTLTMDVENESESLGTDESKYIKKSSLRRKTLWMPWSTFVIVYGIALTVFLTFISYDMTQQSRMQEGKLSVWKRALHILAKRKEHTINLRKSETHDDENEEEDKAGPDVKKKTEIEHSDKDKSIIENLQRRFQKLDNNVRNNLHCGIRWIKDELLRELPGEEVNPVMRQVLTQEFSKRQKRVLRELRLDFNVKRRIESAMKWEQEWKGMTTEQKARGPKVDYTKHKYQYPDLEPSPTNDYPNLDTMETIMTRWPQDRLDDPPETIIERLMHFNYSNPRERKMALEYREAELPFKVYDIPEISAIANKWTDEYVTAGFDGTKSHAATTASGSCQESQDNFFSFFTPMGWHMGSMGPPPYRSNDWNYAKWVEHANYADAVSLSFDQPHFYWQSGVPKEERHNPKSEWSFISLDLPQFSSTESNFFQFHPEEQKGIQCRFGERGVTAATHYDTGRNMIAMLQGAKRYILSPPRECSKLGIVTLRGNTLYRHSLLNFGHLEYLDREEGKKMPERERAWLERSRSSLAIDTVLKAGEVLYVPSHWFHYITSLQKSAQCNVRSGVDTEGTEKFGGLSDVEECEE